MNDNSLKFYALYGIAIFYLGGSFLGWFQCVRFWKSDLWRRMKTVMLMRLFQPFVKGTFWYSILLPVPIAIMVLYGAIKGNNLHFVVISIMFLLSLLFMYTTPPVVLFLGVSSRSSKKLRLKIGWVTPGTPANLLRGSRYSPQSSFRSMSSMWRTIVKGLWIISGLIVIDARSESDFVVEEVLQLFSQGQGHKTVFVIEDNGSQPLIDTIDPDGMILANTGYIVVPEKNAADTISNLTQSIESLPGHTTNNTKNGQ